MHDYPIAHLLDLPAGDLAAKTEKRAPFLRIDDRLRMRTPESRVGLLHVGLLPEWRPA